MQWQKQWIPKCNRCSSSAPARSPPPPHPTKFFLPRIQPSWSRNVFFAAPPFPAFPRLRVPSPVAGATNNAPTGAICDRAAPAVQMCTQWCTGRVEDCQQCGAWPELKLADTTRNPRAGELENCSTATASTRPTMADCSFAFADPRFPMLIKVCQRGWKYWKLTQMIINLPSFFSPTPNISTDIGNEGTL